MIKTIAVHGRQPGISRAELESLYGKDSLTKVTDYVSGLDVAGEDIDFGRLGGSIKLAHFIHELEASNWSDIEKHLTNILPELLQNIPEGKLKLGLSVYGLHLSVSKLNASALSLKKVIKNTGRSVRIIPNKELALNSAQVLHNHLSGPTGLEILIINSGKRTIIARTFAVQDIDAYAARDQARPKRDARVGMLPPKLAQTIVNLAAGQISTGSDVILDPFCGTGVILQEATLMGFNVYGTDLDERMVDYSRANLEWLNITSVDQRVEQGDATSTSWSEPFDCIAAETYLGRPFAAVPKIEVLQEVMRDVDTIHRKFLKNVARQTKTGFRMCIAIPAWKVGKDFQHLSTLDHLEELGYTRAVFKFASLDELIYHRDGQVVGRELVVLIRI